MSIGHPIHKIQLFQNLTLKIQGQGHGGGECWKSQHGSDILSTHIPFVPCQSALPFLRYSIFKIWPCIFKVKVMGEGNVESHKVGVTSYRPWKSKVKVKWPWCCTTTGLDNSIKPQMEKSIQWFQRYGLRKFWPKCCLILQVFGPWASPNRANGQITMTLHNYRSRQVHETLNGVNPSSSFRDMRSAKSGPNLWQIWQVFGPWARPYGANGEMTRNEHLRKYQNHHCFVIVTLNVDFDIDNLTNSGHYHH